MCFVCVEKQIEALDGTKTANVTIQSDIKLWKSHTHKLIRIQMHLLYRREKKQYCLYDVKVTREKYDPIREYFIHSVGIRSKKTLE